MSTSLGERRHETCRYGDLTPGFRVEVRTGRETPLITPLCRWQPADAPPAVLRAWGGLVEFDRDCAVCPAHSPL